MATNRHDVQDEDVHIGTVYYYIGFSEGTMIANVPATVYTNMAMYLPADRVGD